MADRQFALILGWLWFITGGIEDLRAGRYCAWGTVCRILALIAFVSSLFMK